MNDDLRVNGLVPLQEPYTALGYGHVGGGGETIADSLLAVSGNNAIVDWVVVELRANGDPSAVLATRAGLLQRDGDVVDVDGTSPLTFPVSAGTYHVAVRHRNHLGIMRANPLLLGATTTVVNLRSSAVATYGVDARMNEGGTMLMWAGNVVPDDRLLYTGANNDRDPILTAIGGAIPTAFVSGYGTEDVNMDGIIKYTGAGNDRDIILVNIGGIIPTNTRVEQLP